MKGLDLGLIVNSAKDLYPIDFMRFFALLRMTNTRYFESLLIHQFNDFLNLFLKVVAKPIKPPPRRKRVVGSGVDAEPAAEAYISIS